MVTERYFVNTWDSKIGVGIEAFPVLMGLTRTSCWFSSSTVNGQALIGEINHQAGNEIDYQEGSTSPDLAPSFASHTSHDASLWFSGL